MHCMDFHLKFTIFLFVYLNVVEFILNHYSSQLVCKCTKFDVKIKVIKIKKQECIMYTHKIEKVICKFE